MNEWRPEGWDSDDKLNDEWWEGCDGLDKLNVAEEAYEAGADAILEALKETGSIMTPEQMKLLAPDREYPYGWLVFIPEDN